METDHGHYPSAASCMGTSSHQLPSLVVALSQLDMHKEMARKQQKRLQGNADARPPTTGAGHGLCSVFQGFPCAKPRIFADGLMACTCPDCKTHTGLEGLKAALLFSNCLDSTCLTNMIFRAVSEATLKEPGV